MCFYPLTLLQNLWYPLFLTTRIDTSQTILHFKSISRFCKKKRKNQSRLPSFVDLRFRSRHHPLAVTRFHPESRPFLSSLLPRVPGDRSSYLRLDSPGGRRGPQRADLVSRSHVSTSASPRCALVPRVPPAPQPLSSDTHGRRMKLPPRSHRGRAKRMRKGHSLSPPPKTLPQTEGSRICSPSVPRPGAQGRTPSPGMVEVK